MFTTITDFLGADARVLIAANILLVVANMALLLRVSFRPSRCYDQVLKMLADEQGDWYIEKVLGHELAKILKHNTRDLEVVPDDDDEDDIDEDDIDDDDEGDSDDEDDDGGDDDEDVDDEDDDDEDDDDEGDDDDDEDDLEPVPSKKRVVKDADFFAGAPSSPSAAAGASAASPPTSAQKSPTKAVLMSTPAGLCEVPAEEPAASKGKNTDSKSWADMAEEADKSAL